MGPLCLWQCLSVLLMLHPLLQNTGCFSHSPIRAIQLILINYSQSTILFTSMYLCIFSQCTLQCVANNEFKFFSLEKISGAQLRFSLIPHLNSSHSPIRPPEIANPPRHVFYKVTFLLIATTTNFSSKVSTQTNID